MEAVILNPTAEAQWLELVQDAERVCAKHLDEDLKSYLVFLLMRYVSARQLASTALALDYLHSISLNGRLREMELNEVGDKCLLFSGLFPGRAERRRVRISYYVELGKSAYSILADTAGGGKSRMFDRLSVKFVQLMDILHAARELGSGDPALTPLQAVELWNDTGSAHALANLRSYTTGTPVHSRQEEPFSGLVRNGKGKGLH